MSLNQLVALTGLLAVTFVSICIFALGKSRPKSFSVRLPRISLPDISRKPAPEESPEPLEQSKRARTIRPASAGGGDLSPVNAVLKDDFYSRAEAQLDHAFSLYERGKISLDTYRQMVRLERNDASKLLKRAEFGIDLGELESGRNIDIEDVRKALAAAAWCLEWADQQAPIASAESVDPPANPSRDAA